MYTSQTRKILTHLKTGHSITAVDAIELFQCHRLAARIKDLRDEGYIILTEMCRGEKSYFASYRMIEKMEAANA